MIQIPERSPHEISGPEWAALMGLTLDEFAAWFEDAIDYYDEDETHNRAFAYGRIVAEWHASIRFILEHITQTPAHPSHVALYAQAANYRLRLEAIEALAASYGFDLVAERYTDEEADTGKLANILANSDVITAKIAESAALAGGEA